MLHSLSQYANITASYLSQDLHDVYPDYIKESFLEEDMIFRSCHALLFFDSQEAFAVVDKVLALSGHIIELL